MVWAAPCVHAIMAIMQLCKAIMQGHHSPDSSHPALDDHPDGGGQADRRSLAVIGGVGCSRILVKGPGKFKRKGESKRAFHFSNALSILLHLYPYGTKQAGDVQLQGTRSAKTIRLAGKSLPGTRNLRSIERRASRHHQITLQVPPSRPREPAGF